MQAVISCAFVTAIITSMIFIQLVLAGSLTEVNLCMSPCMNQGGLTLPKNQFHPYPDHTRVHTHSLATAHPHGCAHAHTHACVYAHIHPHTCMHTCSLAFARARVCSRSPILGRRKEPAPRPRPQVLTEPGGRSRQWREEQQVARATFPFTWRCLCGFPAGTTVPRPTGLT